MGQSNLNLGALIGSRICHDLISPIGAINNGLELLTMTGSVQGPEMDLITGSVENAGARIRFFRIAYGAAGEQMMGRPEIVSVLRDVCRNARVTFEWGPTDPHSRAEIRLAFLAIQCCETAMPYGGRIQVDCVDGKWILRGTGKSFNIDDRLWTDLGTDAGPQDITPATVQFALLSELLTEAKKTPDLTQEEGQIRLCY